ncbi:MAG: orotate phosphoribosyltransferase [Acidobacteria bacterium]|nr:MAG: orotate phosphoribosyltransferase [Acidobacteriota bacterium]
MEERLQLLDLLARDSFRLGEFHLSSGGTSDYYVDCRTTTLSPMGALLTAHLFSEELRQLDTPVEAVGGLTMGADPIVVGVAIESAGTDHPITGFLVRKAEKTHGTLKRIEGLVHPGMKVAIVDDVCTTAASTIQAIEAAWAAELNVVAVRCLVEREEAGGRNNLNQLWRAHRGRACPFAAIFGAQEVRAAHKELLRGGNTIAEASQ